MTNMTNVTDFVAIVNRVADKISKILVEEMETQTLRGLPDVTAVLAGECVAMLGYMGSAPAKGAPPSFVELESALRRVLHEITVFRGGGV